MLSADLDADTTDNIILNNYLIILLALFRKKMKQGIVI